MAYFFGLLEITRGNKRWFPKLDSWVSLCWGAESQAHRVQEASLARQAVVRVEISPTGPSLSSLPPSLCFSLGVSSGEDLSSLGSQRFPGWTACYCWISLAGAPAPALSLRWGKGSRDHLCLSCCLTGFLSPGEGSLLQPSGEWECFPWSLISRAPELLSLFGGAGLVWCQRNYCFTK